MMKITIKIHEGPQAPRQCTPANTIREMMSAGELNHTLSVFGDSMGDCMAITRALMLDLTMNDKDTGWQRVQGYVLDSITKECFVHAWVESDGWAIDFSSGKALVVELGFFIQCKKACVFRRETAEEWRSTLFSQMG